MKHKTAPDEYERRYMRADEALARERVRMAWWGHAIFLVALALALHSAMTHQHFLGAVIVPLVWLLFTTLRVVVTRAAVHVQLGIFGPKIALADIERAEVARGSLVRGGWGIRLGFDGAVTYSVPSQARDYLRIVYRRGNGHRVVRVMSADPARLVRAIDAARSNVQLPRVHAGGEERVPFEDDAELARVDEGQRPAHERRRP